MSYFMIKTHQSFSFELFGVDIQDFLYTYQNLKMLDHVVEIRKWLKPFHWLKIG